MMRMDDQGENFDELRKLLALKKHEVPPPGYFNRFPREVISRIRAERYHASSNVMSKLDAEAPWLARLWDALQGRPIFAGAFGAVVCSLVLAGIYFTNKPAEVPSYATQIQPAAPFVAAASDAAATTLDKPLLMAATNLNEITPPNLFDLVQPLQVAPVVVQPNN